ncbi:tripartite tricarboxylate transporter permease [Pelagibacterium halotolerans]|uniref:tripartite tricarboxylate transporter permease n=1 Tax=Pelagibacterium halotolerans TaxID=531813 RepID=UPI00089A48F0|nr:tripartite tricarboxylate transporter permease [Pelagibacterium halotolerans]QJR19632.1 tripartite tricarboxylate transporter permease [Pelagibacterium halotolerans]SDZ86114.1 TctA family transporter [Pelagibacterium halotolerans]
MDLLSNLALGFSVALSASSLLYCALGVTLGMFIGVLPGIGPLATVGMLLPLTFYAGPTDAIIMLAGIYYGSMYGGSTASILLNLPGTAGAAVTCLDGYPMARKGRAGVALFATTIASFIGGLVGILILAAFAPVLARIALTFGSPEYFALMTVGLLAAALVGDGSPSRSLAMVLLGLLLGIVGTDVNSGVRRFTGGFSELGDGLNLVIVTTGLFGISEVIANAGRIKSGAVRSLNVTWRSLLPTREDWKRSVAPQIRGTSIGALLGILPGTGAALSTFVAYAVEKRVSPHRQDLGKGAIEGVVAPEAANNAAAQTAFIPTLSLGIPGDAIVAIMLGALIIHGIVPGPRLVVDQPELFWGLTVSFLIGNVMLLILNLPLIGVWVRILSIPYGVLYPAILVFICVGVFSIRNSVFDVVLAIVCGVVGYGLRLMRFSPAPMLLGLVLGPLIETNLRRSLLLSRGDPMVFLERPVSVTVLGFGVALVVYFLWSAVALKRKRAKAVSDAQSVSSKSGNGFAVRTRDKTKA